jgi:hypothetical protein
MVAPIYRQISRYNNSMPPRPNDDNDDEEDEDGGAIRRK